MLENKVKKTEYWVIVYKLQMFKQRQVYEIIVG
jgi:hypothetical protein